MVDIRECDVVCFSFVPKWRTKWRRIMFHMFCWGGGCVSRLDVITVRGMFGRKKTFPRTLRTLIRNGRPRNGKGRAPRRSLAAVPSAPNTWGPLEEVRHRESVDGVDPELGTKMGTTSDVVAVVVRVMSHFLRYERRRGSRYTSSGL